jgi:hypothetical protein
MGQAARALAESNFDGRKNARSILALYERVVDRFQHSAVG